MVREAMKKHSKRYRLALKQVKEGKSYELLADAFQCLLEMPAAQFDETVELSMHLAVDPKQSDQMVRGIVQLPHGSGKEVRVVAFTTRPEEAVRAGACAAGLADLIEKVKEGWLDFDVAVATPEAMKEVKVVARILGPRGLMPNPKTGTITDDLVTCIEALKKGRVEFKMDKSANVQMGIGKRSLGIQKLVENAESALQAIQHAHPTSLKGKFVKRAVVSTTMSPGLTLHETLLARYGK
jgi:large subunit ribosomal protein L1